MASTRCFLEETGKDLLGAVVVLGVAAWGCKARCSCMVSRTGPGDETAVVHCTVLECTSRRDCRDSFVALRLPVYDNKRSLLDRICETYLWEVRHCCARR